MVCAHRAVVRYVPADGPASPRVCTRSPGFLVERDLIQVNTPTKPRVLVLDEDRIILQSLGQFLRREGYDVRTSDRPEEALALMEAGHVELLLVDVSIPGVKPAQFLR